MKKKAVKKYKPGGIFSKEKTVRPDGSSTTKRVFNNPFTGGTRETTIVRTPGEEKQKSVKVAMKKGGTSKSKKK
jgi:hypothetical protein